MTYYGAKELADSFRTVRKNTLLIAEEIPEEQYGYRGAADTRTIGEMLAHIAAGLRTLGDYARGKNVTVLIESHGDFTDSPALLDSSLRYVVPAGMITQPVYFRGGNSADELITIVLMRDGAPMRYFPMGAKDGVHVPLRVVEDLIADTVIEVFVAAPDGLSGTVFVDIGLVEI